MSAAAAEETPTRPRSSKRASDPGDWDYRGAEVSVRAIALIVVLLILAAGGGVILNEALIAARATAGDPGNAPGSLVCRFVGPSDAALIEAALSDMRSTEPGAELYSLFQEHDVCITVVSQLRERGRMEHRRVDGHWRHSFVTLNSDFLRRVEPDVAAALLVHEATHLERMVDGVDCARSGGCTRLANGVLLEEELAAHEAEARWWIARHGRHGKHPADLDDRWLNDLALRYLAGSYTFAGYVWSMRVE